MVWASPGREFKSQIGNFFIAAGIGTGIGILPGIGGGTAGIMSYTTIKNRSKTPEKFGTGIMDGIVASETANNAAIGGAMIPLLTTWNISSARTAARRWRRARAWTTLARCRCACRSASRLTALPTVAAEPDGDVARIYKTIARAVAVKDVQQGKDFSSKFPITISKSS